MEKEWVDITDNYSERSRHYNGKYLLKSMLLDEEVEIQIYSFDDDDYVYVREDYHHNSICVGIRINSLKDANKTTAEVIKIIYKYQELRKQIYDIFKKSYGVDI